MPSPKLKHKNLPLDFGCGFILIDTQKVGIVSVSSFTVAWALGLGGIWNIPVIQSSFISVQTLKGLKNNL